MSELIKNFGVDWKLLIAQAVNFAVLLFLLKRFAYQPVLAMLRKRKDEIERGLALTKEAEQTARHADELQEETLQRAHHEAFIVVQRAETTAKDNEEKMLAAAARKSEGIVQDARRVITQENARMGEEVYQNAQDLIREGITRVLGKLPSEARDQLLIQEALRELKAKAAS